MIFVCVCVRVGARVYVSARVFEKKARVGREGARVSSRGRPSGQGRGGRLMKMFRWHEGFDCPTAKLLADLKTACFISNSFSCHTLALVNVTIKHRQCRNLITKPFILLKEK